MVNGTTDLAYTCCCEQTPSTCYDDPQYREGTLTGMNCQQWSLTDTNNDYFADCSMADALYVTPTGPSSCAGHSDESGHPTTDQMANSYACEVGGYGPLTNKTRAAHHPDHAQSRASTCPGEGADDDAFRLRGFSCAQWGVKRPNGIVECMPSEDAHWMASDEAYTQAELDSLRTNCPATCKPFEMAARDVVRENCPVSCDMCQAASAPLHKPCAAFEGSAAVKTCPQAVKMVCSACDNAGACNMCLSEAPADRKSVV